MEECADDLRTMQSLITAIVVTKIPSQTRGFARASTSFKFGYSRTNHFSLTEEMLLYRMSSTCTRWYLPLFSGTRRSARSEQSKRSANRTSLHGVSSATEKANKNRYITTFIVARRSWDTVELLVFRKC